MKYSETKLQQDELTTQFIDELLKSERARIEYADTVCSSWKEAAEMLDMNQRTYARKLVKYGFNRKSKECLVTSRK